MNIEPAAPFALPRTISRHEQAPGRSALTLNSLGNWQIPRPTLRMPPQRPAAAAEQQDDSDWGSDFDDVHYTEDERKYFELRYTVEGLQVAAFELGLQPPRLPPPPPPRRLTAGAALSSRVPALPPVSVLHSRITRK